MSAASDKRIKLALAVTVLLLALGFQGSRGIWEPDEGRYTDIALQMLNTGDFITPQLSPGRPHYAKPPLTYWSIAASVALFGRNAWAARLPNAIAFVLTCLIVFGFGRYLVPAKPWLPALVYATSLGPFVAANIVTTDTLLTLWETLAVFGFWAAYEASGPRRRHRYTLLMWAGFGLAFLTKGPPGLLALLPALLFWARQRGLRALPQLFPLTGIGLFLLIGLGWFAVIIIQHLHLLDYFFQYEFVDRIFTGVHHRHPQWYAPFTVYLPMLVLGCLFWPLWLLDRCWSWLRGLFSRTREGGDRLAVNDGFLWLWVLLPLAIFCLAQSRLYLYVLPLFVPLALLMARALKDRVDMSKHGVRALLLVWIAFLIAVKAGTARLSDDKDTGLLAGAIRQQLAIDTVARIFFVDTAPRWGLMLYLDKSPREIPPVYTPSRVTASRSSLCARLSPTPAHDLLITKGALSKRRQHELAHCNKQTVAKGAWRDLRFYSLIPRVRPVSGEKIQ